MQMPQVDQGVMRDALRVALDPLIESGLILADGGRPLVRLASANAAGPRLALHVPSQRLARTVCCSSYLAADLAILLDTSPWIMTFGEYPAAIVGACKGQGMVHVPDFAALQDGRLMFLDARPARDVTPEVRRRARALRDGLGDAATYELMTERDIHHAPQRWQACGEPWRTAMAPSHVRHHALGGAPSGVR